MKRIFFFLSFILVFSLGSSAQEELQVLPDTLLVEQILDSLADLQEPIVPSYDYTLDSLLHDWYAEKVILSDCTFDVDSVVHYADSIYIARLQGLPYEMEMPFNNIVKRYIEMYAKRQKQVGSMLGMGESYYFPLFEEKLNAYGVPLELRYLPVIESALNAKAISRVGAGGLWQFMVRTGKEYGLEVNSLVDERFDPVKSTDAAARFLSDLYRLYGDWHLVIAAYNCGPGNVAKAIRHAGGKRDYWSIYPYLPRETRGYVPIFIAANYIMNYYEDHNICPSHKMSSFVTDTVMVTDRVHLVQVSEVLNIPIEELRFLNPQYKRDLIPGNVKAYPLVLTFEQINGYAENRDTILAHRAEIVTRNAVIEPAGYSSHSGNATYYKVKSGDTLGGIAARNRVTVKQLQQWNGIKGTMIRVGQRLVIYK